MPKDPTPPDLLVLALTLVAERGWAAFSFAELARRAGIGLTEVYAEFPDRAAVLRALGRRLDAEMLGIDLAELDAMTWRERVFELVMRRLDAMAPYKAGLQVLAREAARDPLLVGVACRTVDRVACRILDAAGSEGGPVTTALTRRVVAAIYARTFRVWLDDATPDMGRTLAELDRRLQQAEAAAGWLASLCRGRRRPDPGATEAVA
jgi:AcrR family transcriptional regulator